MGVAESNLSFSRALLDELAASGVRHLCLCPGSRSTPLVMAAAATGSLEVWTHLDERSAGFFALGLAKASRTPVAIACTSGTAAANFLPAVVEAHYGGVPLVVLTADRPQELRECGAGQTIDQVRLYGSHVRWFSEASVPTVEDALEPHARAIAARAVRYALERPAGPTHLNLPFREPLAPPPGTPEVVGDGSAPAAPRFGSRSGVRSPHPDSLAEIEALVRRYERGIIVAGPCDEPDLAPALALLARTCGWPLVGEPTSQLRSGPHVPISPLVSTADLLLRDARVADRLAPDVVLRFGAPPTSKAFRLWLENRPPASLVVVDPDHRFENPSALPAHFEHADPTALATALVRRLERSPRETSPWLEAWRAADRAATAEVRNACRLDDAPLEPRAIEELARALPEDATLVVSNSLPVRDVDDFWPASEKPLRVVANRGANGIDGVLSTALGAAAADRSRRVVLVVGDLAFLHDIGGLFAATRHGLEIAIVVVQNDGGAIFSLLPIAAHGDAVRFDDCFRLSHGLDIGPLARSYGLDHIRVTSAAHLGNTLKAAFSEGGARVIEIPVDPEQSNRARRELASKVASASQRALDGVLG